MPILTALDGEVAVFVEPRTDGEDTFFSVPWGHHLYIITQCKDVNKAMFYLCKTVEQGWSRAVLLNFLDTDLFERQGKAVNNFSRLLPALKVIWQCRH